VHEPRRGEYARRRDYQARFGQRRTCCRLQKLPGSGGFSAFFAIRVIAPVWPSAGRRNNDILTYVQAPGFYAIGFIQDSLVPAL